MLEHKEHAPEPGQSQGPGMWKRAVYRCRSLHGERDVPVCARAAWPCKAVQGTVQLPLTGVLVCQGVHRTAKVGKSVEHQIKHEPTPKSRLRGGKGHFFLQSRGRNCAAHPQAAPGCCLRALGSAWGRLAPMAPEAQGCSASLARNSSAGAAVAFSPSLKEKPGLSPAAGHGPCCGHKQFPF